ncbi:MAG: hypothetical protein WC307_05325 [Candidatus Nanoarchaeia archaeon]
MGSKDFNDAKKLIYLDKFEVTAVNVEIIGPANKDKSKKSFAMISFKKEGIIKEIRSEEDDFISLAFSIKDTIRNGEKKLIEIKDTNKYYDNIDLLLPKNKDVKKDIEDAINQINEGKSPLIKGFNLYDTFKKLVNNEFGDAKVKLLLTNYFEVIASQIINIKRLKDVFEQTKHNQIKNIDEFESFTKSVDDITNKYILNYSPIESLTFYIKNSKIDAELLINNFIELEATISKKWSALTKGGTEGVEGESAAKFILDDYSDYFEISQKILTDLAVFINEKVNRFETINSFYRIKVVLAENGFSNIVKLITEKLRHSATHWSIDYSKKGKVLVYDTISRERKLLFEKTYEDLINSFNVIKNLTRALFFSYLMNREIIFFRVLDSLDLKFLLIEKVR